MKTSLENRTFHTETSKSGPVSVHLYLWLIRNQCHMRSMPVEIHINLDLNNQTLLNVITIVIPSHTEAKYSLGQRSVHSPGHGCLHCGYTASQMP